MDYRGIHGLKFANFWRVLLLFTIGLFCSTASTRADDAPLKPFRIKFIEYQQSPADGTYTFTLYLVDVPKPHIHWPDGRGEPKTKYKIGDMIGRYKVMSFTPKIKPPNPNILDSHATDESILILQNIDKPDDQINIPYLREVDAPEVGALMESK